MKIALGCDHGGFSLKRTVVAVIKTLGHTVVDCGATSLDLLDDYPDYARAVGVAVRSGRAERGILICGSGVGASVAATKVRGIRAAVCHDTYSAHQGVEHDNMNVLCLGARVVGEELIREIVKSYLSASFSTGKKYVRRLKKVLELEENESDGTRLRSHR